MAIITAREVKLFDNTTCVCYPKGPKVKSHVYCQRWIEHPRQAQCVSGTEFPSTNDTSSIYALNL